LAVFVIVDLSLRLILRRMEQAKARKEREKALDRGLRLEFADEARSLKRVEVPAPRARILAVDDEPVVLDSFRKILVLAGFSVDTVESGPEALALVKQHDYDFVFTDLKMPEMDGLEVAKAVKHLRPDVDIAIITGYGTVETAVSAMQYGAVDYVEKPFTEDELVAFAARLLIRRQDRLERLALPEIRLVTPSSASVTSSRVVNVPGGVYVSNENTWVSVELNGESRVGLDDFFQKSVGAPESLEFPKVGDRVRVGDELFALRRGGQRLGFRAPISGRVSRVNHEVEYHLELMRLRPYEYGWVCALEPADLKTDLAALTIGAEAVDWYRGQAKTYHRELEAELERRRESTRSEEKDLEVDQEAAWSAFGSCFLRDAASRTPALATPGASGRDSNQGHS